MLLHRRAKHCKQVTEATKCIKASPMMSAGRQAQGLVAGLAAAVAKHPRRLPLGPPALSAACRHVAGREGLFYATARHVAHLRRVGLGSR